ncbi:MAG TPA: hypothetical protein VHX66_00530 [Solirubrobacteraceae bacterium]|jgi:hypothetical protein|nr:hypothetical protein [Solirubrobacteraceae bacterium]
MDEQGFAWEGSQPIADPAGPPPVARGISLRAWDVAFALLAVVVAGGALLLTAGGGSSSSTPVTLAADTSTQQLGYRFDITIGASASGFNFSLNGSGALNVRPSVSGSMNMSLLGNTVDEIFSGSYIYVQTAPSSWYRANLPADAGNSATEQNPTAELDYLRAAGTVTDLGSETVNGVATEHYHALADLGRLASIEGDQDSPQTIATLEQEIGGSTLPLDVWIDSSHLVRRLSLSIPIKQGGVTINASVKIDFLSYGAQPVVAPPPASEVTETPPPSGA